MDEDPIQKAIDAIKEVLQVHEHHIFPLERLTLRDMIKHFEGMKKAGFR